jgi:hypothetical protein
MELGRTRDGAARCWRLAVGEREYGVSSMEYRLKQEQG